LLNYSLVSKINKRYHQLIKNLCEKLNIKAKGFYLDAGCGNGSHWKDADLEGLIGIDINYKALQVMHDRYPMIPLIEGDICCLPFASSSLDGIFALAVLEHLYYLEHAIDEIHRVLKPDGKLVVSIPTEGGYFWNIGRKLTTDRYFSRKYGINHAHVARITHCNTAKKVIKCLYAKFDPLQERYDPFMVPLLDVNLFFYGIFMKK
jgi:SAM-dependent methyltransferase